MSTISGKGVVTDILAARLARVADKFALFVIVDGLSPNGSEDNAEDDEHGEPQLPHEGGVVVDLLQQPREEAPAHGVAGQWGRQCLSLTCSQTLEKVKEEEGGNKREKKEDIIKNCFIKRI